MQRSVNLRVHRAERSAVCTEHLDDLRAELALLNLQFAAFQARQFLHLQQQLKLLADFFEDTADGVVPAGSDASRFEFRRRHLGAKFDLRIAVN